ncbi:MAG: ribosome-associated translation inhibitor RaiA [Candidatus Cloacimonadales bacterium]
MQISITARHFDLTDAIRDHIEGEMERIGKYFHHIISAQFVLKLEKDRNYAEVILHVPKNSIATEAEEDNMYLAIDNAIDKAEKKLKKLKGKWDDHQKTSLSESSKYVYANLIKEGDISERISTKRIMAETFSLDEAIDQFNANSDPYFIFKNIETDRINVLVKKDDQHFKLLEP